MFNINDCPDKKRSWQRIPQKSLDSRNESPGTDRNQLTVPDREHGHRTEVEGCLKLIQESSTNPDAVIKNHVHIL